MKTFGGKGRLSFEGRDCEHQFVTSFGISLPHENSWWGRFTITGDGGRFVDGVELTGARILGLPTPRNQSIKSWNILAPIRLISILITPHLLDIKYIMGAMLRAMAGDNETFHRRMRATTICRGVKVTNTIMIDSNYCSSETKQNIRKFLGR